MNLVIIQHYLLYDMKELLFKNCDQCVYSLVSETGSNTSTIDFPFSTIHHSLGLNQHQIIINKFIYKYMALFLKKINDVLLKNKRKNSYKIFIIKPHFFNSKII